MKPGVPYQTYYGHCRDSDAEILSTRIDWSYSLVVVRPRRYAACVVLRPSETFRHRTRDPDIVWSWPVLSCWRGLVSLGWPSTLVSGKVARQRLGRLLRLARFLGWDLVAHSVSQGYSTGTWSPAPLRKVAWQGLGCPFCLAKLLGRDFFGLCLGTQFLSAQHVPIWKLSGWPLSCILSGASSLPILNKAFPCPIRISNAQ